MNTISTNLRQRPWRVIALALIIAIAGIVLSSVSPVLAQQGQGDGSFQPAACSFIDLPANLLSSLNLQCGWLTVPEKHANPNGPTIQLGVAIIKSGAPASGNLPLVMLQGGPGGSTIETYLQLIPLDPRLKNLNRDIILFDQRGTKYSKPSLFCQEYYDETIRQLNLDITKTASNQQAQQALQACHNRFVSEGIDLSAFNSLENAADVNSLVKALGYQQVNLYGVSYGTLLALHVMRQFPDILRTVTIDSVVPPQTNFIIQAPQSENRSLDAVFTSCASHPACSQTYPNLKQVFYNLVDQLNQNKIHITLTDFKTGKTYPALVDGDTFINVVVQMLYQTDLVPMIPRFIYDVRAGNYATLERILSLVVFDKSVNYGMYFSVLCAEDADFTPQQYNLSGLPKELVQAEQDSATEFLKTCGFWNVNQLSPAVDAPVTSSIPTLVLSGAFDPVTPPAYAQEAASTLSNSYFFEFPIGGHGEVTSGTCQDSIFIQFLNNPQQKPDATCINQQQMVFSTPATLVHFPVLLSLLNLQGPIVVQLAIYAVALLFLLTAFLVYPIAWLIRVLRRRPAAPVYSPTPALSGAEMPVEPAGSATQPVRTRPHPWLYRLGPWLAVLTGALLLAFIAIVYVVGLSLALANDNRILFGLPASSRPLFFMPLAAIVTVLLMLIGAVLAWMHRSGSAGGRIYFTLLSLAGVTCLVILGLWGAITALFPG